MSADFTGSPNRGVKLTAVLRTYRLLSSLATPFAPLLLARRLKRGKENSERIAERRGNSRDVRPDGALIWLHAASVGELVSALPLIERIARHDVNVLVTSGTVTSSELAGQRLPPGIVHQFVPLDAPRFMRRFLDRWQPDLALFVESDLWPNMLIETSRRGVPMILINGRLSEKSFQRWRKSAQNDLQSAHPLRSLSGPHAGRCPSLDRIGRAARRHHRQPQARRAAAVGRPCEA